VIRVLVVEDQAMVLGALSALLDLEDDIEVVARAQDGAEALRLAERLQPDLVIADIEMPQVTGIELAARLVERGMKVARHVLQAGVQVASPNSFLAVHVGQRRASEQDDACRAGRNLEQRSRKLVTLDLFHHLVDSAASFLADVGPAHERSERLVPRSRWAVEEAPSVHQRLAWVRDLDAPVEDLHHGARPRSRRSPDGSSALATMFELGAGGGLGSRELGAEFLEAGSL